MARGTWVGTWAGVGSMMFVVVACSSSDSSGGSASPDAACTSFTTTLCSKLKTCFPDAFPALYADDATCQARLKISCLNSANAKNTAIKTSDIDACASAYGGLECSKAFDFDRDPPEACKAKAGPGAAGSPCQDDSQCATKYCKLGTASACGACGTKAAAGGHCDDSKDCDYGLDCGGNNTCVVLGAAGEACTSDKPCRTGLVCKTGAAGSTSGTCSAPSNAGDPCNGQECDGTKALFCNQQTKTCQKVGFATAGSACGLTGGSVTLCTGSGSNCNLSEAGTGTCQAAIADGAACGQAGNGASCQAPARCVNNVCTLPTSCGG